MCIIHVAENVLKDCWILDLQNLVHAVVFRPEWIWSALCRFQQAFSNESLIVADRIDTAEKELSKVLRGKAPTFCHFRHLVEVLKDAAAL